MDARIQPLYEIFKFNTRNFLNCLEGMDEDQAGWRAGEDTNSAAYIALHVLDSRHFLARTIGLALEHKLGAAAKEARNNPRTANLPSIEDIRREWKSVTGEARARLAQLGTPDLGNLVETKLPMEDKTVLGIIAFNMMHESYHIGQLGLLRKQVGLPAMALR